MPITPEEVVFGIDATHLKTKTFAETKGYLAPPRVGTIDSSATPTPDAALHDLFTVTGLAVNAVFAVPTGTPVEGQPLIIRIKDAGAAKTLGWNAIYRAVGLTLPSITVIGKTTYLGMIYNAVDSKWDVLSVIQEA